jgi:membrane protease YdiL (CAAX protease family)
MFERVRLARPIALPFPPLIVALLGLVTPRLLSEVGWLGLIDRATRGGLSPHLVVSLIGIGLVLGSVVWIGGIEIDDTGLNRDQLGRGIGVTAMIWVAAQVLGVLPRVVANRPVALDRSIEHGSAWPIVSQLLDALGSATIEEIAFRGFLLVQLYLLLRLRSSQESDSLGGAIAISVLLGNLAALAGPLPFHGAGAVVESQAILLAQGLFLSWIFLRTRNLFFVIGVHTLILAPTPVVAGPHRGGAWFFPAVIAVLATVWTLLWPKRD